MFIVSSTYQSLSCFLSKKGKGDFGGEADSVIGFVEKTLEKFSNDCGKSKPKQLQSQSQAQLNCYFQQMIN